MKTLIAAFAALTLTACASTAPYEHSRDTHARAVKHHLGTLQVNIDTSKIPAAITLVFEVEPSGSIKKLSIHGATFQQKRTVRQALAKMVMLPPHNEPEPITYSTEVVFP